MSRLNGNRPLIGITTSEVRRAETIEQTAEGDPPRHEMALGLTYLRAIESAGGIPVVMPPLHSDAIEPLLDRLNGICLSGGPDLDPESYHGPRHPNLGPTEPELDRFELEIAAAADQRGKPILAICRGAQAINVARGGSLLQHIPEAQEKAVNRVAHRQKEPGDVVTHEIEIEASSLLGQVIGGEQAAVNSFHHQAAEQLGAGLVPVAWAPDGILEGLEDPERPFLVGVQWHAECLVDRPEQLALFRAFVEASAASENGGR
ncbi:MAG: gamma-glutamyl-gamma-aminobutyrate hydrolase family protein [Solirubrobacterales bacterium]